jgi:hypothetical protein
MDIVGALPRSGVVWGGDWNHALSGREFTGTAGGRVHVLAAIRLSGCRFRPGPCTDEAMSASVSITLRSRRIEKLLTGIVLRSTTTTAICPTMIPMS